MKNMNKIIIFIVATFLIASCNVKPSQYTTAQPWSGVKPLSAVVSGHNYFANLGVFTANTAPANSILFTSSSDTTWADSTKNERTLTFTFPNGGGSTNTSFLIDTANKQFTANYTITKKSLHAASLNTIISTNSYTSLKSIEGLRMQNYMNTSTEITGLFYGYLTRSDGLKSVYIDNGYFSVTK
jgi:hypothetical protein